jgi:hypothetical protein
MNKAGIEAGSLCGLLDSATGSAQEFSAPCSGSVWTEGRDKALIMPSAPIRIRPGEDGRLIVQFPYAPDHVAKIKTLVGRRWHAQERHWTIPQDKESLSTLLSLFPGEPVDVDPALGAACTHDNGKPSPAMLVPVHGWSAHSVEGPSLFP